VGKGAVIRDSVIFEDSVIEAGALVDLAICDKQVRIGANAIVGHGDNKSQPNREYPQHLYTGISLVGKKAQVPAKMKIGRNSIVRPGFTADALTGCRQLDDGEVV